MKSILRSVALAMGVLASGAAQAANALVTTDLNVRSGPGAGYPAIGMFPNGSRVNVGGCTSGYGWCQVNYGGMTGWASSRYLAIREGGSATYSGNDFGSNAAAIGIPLIAGVAIGAAIANNHDRDRDRWERRHWRDRDRWDRRRDWDRRDRWDRRDGWRDGRRWERRGWQGRMGDGPHGQ
ncbi:SH3 domain-containing protein [Phyllobacterium leguminum]|uniref:Uncharacterized protein YraI n=1 Tax=Phyllobacterium leguminum TaxID=314237 RepID=A0A318SYU7_9HYPH|nr:SH3 domain-containing protein [Phyllobacterium leguminum]PYE86515.1 uncharacterized protein YraI [Phyllobacterium leguminum]